MRISFLLLSVLAYTISLAQQQDQKLLISHLTDNFYVYTSFGDPGDGSKYPANGMYVVTNSGVVLFDTPWDTTQFQPLLDSINARHHQQVTICISGHFHDDRTAGLEYYKLKGIKTYTSKLTDELSKAKNNPRSEYLITRDTTFKVGQYHFETYYPGHGHSPDNIVAWFGQEKILYGGCFIKSADTESPGNLSDANIDEWIKSVKNVQAKFRKPRFVIPGHQSWQNATALTHTLEILIKYKNNDRQQRP